MLTVLFATRNGAKTLPQVLECYCRLDAPLGGWNLVIVDNGSTDGTRGIIHSYQRRLPLTCLFESRPGKNAALNAGLQGIAGDLVVLTDDDAFPHVNWLKEMRAVADAHPDYAVFGGTILARWEVPPAFWISAWAPVGAAFAVSDPSVPEGPATAHQVFGPNMAVRAEIFARGFRFDTEIGPRGKRYPMGSETEFVRRLLREGFMAWRCRRSIVEHFIPRSRMRMSWILGRAVRFGRGQYRLDASERELTIPCWAGVPRYIFREMLEQQLRMAVGLLSADWERLFHARWQFNHLWGQAIEARAMRAEILKARQR
jgi:glycosyltransferase involved in cell wall biosynthesis